MILATPLFMTLNSSYVHEKSLFPKFKGIFNHFITLIRRYKQKKIISKITDDLNFPFTICYARLCVAHFSMTTALNYVSSMIIFVKLFSYHTDMISAWLPNSIGKMCFLGEIQIHANNSNFENFETTLYMKLGSMPFSWSAILHLGVMQLLCSISYWVVISFGYYRNSHSV